MLLVLLPLAAGTSISNWISIRSADEEKTAFMAAATRQNAAQLALDLNAIRTSSSLTANVLAFDQHPGNVCDRMVRLLRSLAGSTGIETAVVDKNGTLKCGTGGAAALARNTNFSMVDDQPIILAPELGGILIRSSSRDGTIRSVSLYKRTALQHLVSGNADLHRRVALQQGSRRLLLTETSGANSPLGSPVTAQAPVGDSGMELLFAMNGGDHNARFISLLMPLILWFTAALLGWLVVRWALIEPLTALRREVADYQPGKVIVPPRMPRIAAGEIVALGEAFRDMSEDVAEHEDEMREALERQTRLTREVHHRVKNNLQIISSLISLHWRAAPDPTTGNAYLSIQRRVDALAVVQRKHYAELDEHRGVRARPMMNEIASGLKTSAQIQSGRNLMIAVDCDDVYLHQDVAAPIAFMTAELADLVIALGSGQGLEVSLLRHAQDSNRARFEIASPAFARTRTSDSEKVELFERVLTGLARQLRTPLEHDVEGGKYHIDIPLLG